MAISDLQFVLRNSSYRIHWLLKQRIILFFLKIKTCVLLRFISIRFSILLVLVFSNQITYIFVSLLELHFVHTFPIVPVQEGLSLVHRSELCGQSLEDSLQRGSVGNERTSLFRILWRNFNNGRLHVVWNPFDKVVRVRRLPLLNILINFLCRHFPPEEQRSGHVFSIIWLHIGKKSFLERSTGLLVPGH